MTLCAVKFGAPFIHIQNIWVESNHRRMSEAESSSGESDYENPAPLKPTITTKAKTNSDPPSKTSQKFKPDRATFTMSSSTSDPPTTAEKSYGFSADEMGIGSLQDLSGSINQIVFVNPEDPQSLPKGFVAWVDEGLVEENRVQLWVKKVGILVLLDSPESAEIVASSTNAKLEKNGYGFSFEVPHQDPNFVQALDEIVDIVAGKTSKTLRDPDGKLFANKVSLIIQWHFVSQMKKNLTDLLTLTLAQNCSDESGKCLSFKKQYQVSRSHRETTTKDDHTCPFPVLLQQHPLQRCQGRRSVHPEASCHRNFR